MITLADRPQDTAFRFELRTWLEHNLPDGWLDGRRDLPHDERARYEFYRAWQRRLFDGGWLAPEWPTEYGGRGARPRGRTIYTPGTGAGAAAPPPPTASLP